MAALGHTIYFPVIYEAIYVFVAVYRCDWMGGFIVCVYICVSLWIWPSFLHMVGET